MVVISTRSSGGGAAVFAGEVRIGYAIPGGDSSGAYVWEFCMRSEALGCSPMGRATDRGAALERVARCFRAWCVAAGLGNVETEIAE